LVRFNDTRDFRILAIMVCILELELGIAKAFVFGIVIGMALWPLVCSIAIYPVHYFEKLFCWFYTDVLRVMHGLRSIPLQSWCGAIPRERARRQGSVWSVSFLHITTSPLLPDVNRHLPLKAIRLCATINARNHIQLYSRSVHHCTCLASSHLTPNVPATLLNVCRHFVRSLYASVLCRPQV
jgi:hypothetical protein